MAITTIDQLVSALGNTSQTLLVNKASIASQVAGGYTSLFRATGTPGQGAIPSTAAVCNNTLLGGLTFTNSTSGLSSYLARANLCCSNAASEILVHDRLAHMGGLNGTLTTAQTAGVDCTVTTSNMANRIGNSDYSGIQWWLEWYTATGSTAVTATVTYTNGSGVSGKTTTVAMAATVAASRMLPIIGASNEPIQSIQSVTLSATTGTAGSFGVTATRFISSLILPVANFTSVADWAGLGLPQVPDSACLMIVQIPSTTSSGTLLGSAKLIQG